MMLGYWNLKEETEKVIKDGWLHTGDIGELDNNNYLKINDEKKILSLILEIIFLLVKLKIFYA